MGLRVAQTLSATLRALAALSEGRRVGMPDNATDGIARSSKPYHWDGPLKPDRTGPATGAEIDALRRLFVRSLLAIVTLVLVLTFFVVRHYNHRLDVIELLAS